MIKIENISINNYRKLRHDTISMDDSITVVAGANNAGKTSLVELMSNIFLKEKNNGISIEDLNNKARQEDEEILFDILNDANLNRESKIEKLTTIHKKLNKIVISISVTYDSNEDNIEYFSQFLSDIDETKRSFYFVIEYEYLPVKEPDLVEMLDRNKDIRELYANLQLKIYYCDEYFKNKIQIENKDLIRFLKIKSLIFTDIDYEYKTDDINKEEQELKEEIIKRKTTNETIIKVTGVSKISDVYKKAILKDGTFLSDKEISVKFQTAIDGYARTLEDALLHKMLKKYETVFTKIPKKTFAKLIIDEQLLLSNTRKEHTSLRDRVYKLQNKTDFMYGLIETGKVNDAIPSYIKEGLNWLRG